MKLLTTVITLVLTISYFMWGIFGAFIAGLYVFAAVIIFLITYILYRLFTRQSI